MQEQQQFPGLHNDSCDQIRTTLEHEWNAKILTPSGHYRATGERMSRFIGLFRLIRRIRRRKSYMTWEMVSGIFLICESF
jgi:hypothetical protein